MEEGGEDREKYDNSIFFTTGKILAEKPWRYFRGEPEMRALLEAGVAVNTLGKHEFDYGVGYLKTALSYNDLPIRSSGARRSRCWRRVTVRARTRSASRSGI